jgi:hypothetical protein
MLCTVRTERHLTTTRGDLSIRTVITCVVRVKRVIFLLWKIFSTFWILRGVPFADYVKPYLMCVCLSAYRHAGGGSYQLRVALNPWKMFKIECQYVMREAQWVDQTHATNLVSVVCGAHQQQSWRISQATVRSWCRIRREEMDGLD